LFSFLTWNKNNGKIAYCGQTVKLPINTPVYWSALSNSKNKDICIKASILNKNVLVTEKQVNIIPSGVLNFIVDVKSDVVIEATQNSIATENDRNNALKVVKEYFEAFAKTDYKTMSTLSTEYHNKNYIHNGDVFGMKWAKAKTIKYYGIRDKRMRFLIDVNMETVKMSALYPDKQTSFFVELLKGKDGIWRIDVYTTG
jgi:hypothetical protein